METQELKKLILFSSTEDKQEASKAKFKDMENYRWFIGNVRDYERLYEAFEDVDIVIHAAAMKRIDICEKEPEEAIKTNLDGTRNVIRAAMERNINKVMMISTDKAVCPINLYGMTKATAEKAILAANTHTGWKDIMFSVCRYGNVVGSNGSVIPVWKKMISDGAKELPITDIRMTRFWYCMEDAITFVIESLLKMRGGEIFIPQIKSVRMTDVAQALNMPYKEVGIRQGEKLHEALDIGYTSDNNDFLTVDEIKKTI
jgi:UDP-N-acetylglucosamine 4,6-dehydratase